MLHDYIHYKKELLTIPNEILKFSISSNDANGDRSSHEKKKEGQGSLKLLRLVRSSTEASPIDWSEQCFVLSNGSDRDLDDLLETSTRCSMMCFLKTSHVTNPSNLLQGFWISVAKTPKRCKEHLTHEGIMSKKDGKDYYTMQLSNGVDQIGKHVCNLLYKGFYPFQHTTEKYIDSWKEGKQQAFFLKFWNSLQHGDAIELVRYSTKRLIETTLYKKPNDKK